MEDLLSRGDEELSRAIELCPRVTSPEELSEETQWAIVPCPARPPETLSAPTQYTLPERDQYRSLRRRLLSAYHRILLQIVPGSRRLRVSHHQEALQRIWEAEEQYRWLLNARDQVLGPAVECLKQKNQATAEYVKELTAGIEGSRRRVADLQARVQQLLAERQALREDLEDEAIAEELKRRVGKYNQQAAFAQGKVRVQQVAEEIARCYREVQYIGDQAEFYEEILVRSRATLRRFDGLIEAAMKQWRDISRTIEVYERPTRDEAGATVAMAILDEVDAVTDDLKESIEAINLNFHSVAESYATASRAKEYTSPVPVDIGLFRDEDEEERRALPEVRQEEELGREDA